MQIIGDEVSSEMDESISIPNIYVMEKEEEVMIRKSETFFGSVLGGSGSDTGGNFDGLVFEWEQRYARAFEAYMEYFGGNAATDVKANINTPSTTSCYISNDEIKKASQ